MEELQIGGRSQQLLLDDIPVPQKTQESQGKFSYLALLRGEIYISCLTDTAHQLQQDANNSNGEASCSKTTTGHSYDLFQESDNGNQNVDDNPWDANLFHDMHLDEVEVDCTRDDAYRHETDHTLNLDAQNGNMQANGDPSESLTANEEKATGEIQEEDADNFLENEKEESEQANTGVSAELTPEIGMQFKSRDEAQQFLNNYSYVAGFSIAVVSVYRTTSKKRNNEVTRATIKCNKHGQNTVVVNEEQILGQRQGTVFVRTDCKVEMVISEKNGVWRITNLKLDHNHPLDPGSRFFRSHVYNK